MRLLRCYIENFGCLHHYELCFLPGLTVIKEDNGFGKSTLAAFIKAMFYGLPRAGKTLEKSDRKRYLPWQGGKYGGYLEFEYEGIEYRIERTFGTVPKEDQFRLYTLSPLTKSTRFSENIGEELFLVNAESFEKTTYMSQMYRSNCFVTSEIKAKVADIAACTDDMDTFEVAVGQLRKKRNQLLSYRGNSGTISRYTEKIAAAEIQLQQAKQAHSQMHDMQEALHSAEENIAQKSKALDKVREQISSYYEISTQNDLAEQYAALQAQEHRIAMEEALLLETYPCGIPTEKDLHELSECLCAPSTHEFMEGIDSNELLKLQELRSVFPNGIPDTAEAQEAKELKQKILEERSVLLQKDSELASMRPHSKFYALAFPLTLTVLCALVSGLFYYIHENIYFQIAGVTTLVLLAITTLNLLIILRHKRKIKILQKEYSTHVLALQSLEAAIKQLLEPYIDDVSDINAVETVLALREEYLYLLNMRRRKSQIEQLRSSAENDRTTKILAQYMLEHLPRTQQTVNILLNDRKKLDLYSHQRKQAHLACQQFKAQYGEPQYLELPGKIEQLREKESTLFSEIRQLQDQLSNLQHQKEQLQIHEKQRNLIEDELTILLEERRQALHKVELLDKAIEHLTAAQKQMSGNFIIPVQNKFADYAALCMSIPRERISVCDDFSVCIEIAGAQRELGYFSTGETDWISLCMRFAIIDVLYQEAAPLLILDDPFVNLDDKRIKSALTMLQKFSHTHQILYLTCSEHRT